MIRNETNHYTEDQIIPDTPLRRVKDTEPLPERKYAKLSDTEVITKWLEYTTECAALEAEMKRR